MNRFALPKISRTVIVFLCALPVLLCSCVAWCADPKSVERDKVSATLMQIAKQKYQAQIRLKEGGQTLWVYLPYSGVRMGRAMAKKESQPGTLEMSIFVNSMNAFAPKSPDERAVFAASEISYVTQKLLGDIRTIALRMDKPYRFYVLVVTNVANRVPGVEDWFMMCQDDIKELPVGEVFEGEPFARLVVHSQPVENAYRDYDGEHIAYYDVDMKDFIAKQIVWRVRKEFDEEYNKTPFDITAAERKQAVINSIAKTVSVYNYNDYDDFVISDLSPGGDATPFQISRLEVLRAQRAAQKRLPAF
jgi:hypothetical protein